MNLKHLTDKTLLNDTKELAKQYRYVTTKLLHHLKEIDQRNLYSELGYSSLFCYVVKELGFSSAIRRIKAARLLEEMPSIEKKIEAGELTLSNLSKASDLFRQNDIKDTERKSEIIGKIENASSRSCEKTLLEISGKELPPPKREIRPITPKLNLLTVTVSEEATKKLELLKGLLAHRKLSQDKLFEVIFEKAHLRLETERFKTESTRKSTTNDPRFVTAGIKKQVYLRDKRCQKCGSQYALEFEHIKPFALGGKATTDNIKILCRNCNQRSRINQKL